MAQETQTPQQQETPVVQEISDEVKVGAHMGQVKWFSDRLGYGYITLIAGDDKGKDIFVHYTGIQPLNSNYKTLTKGEYVNFDIIRGDNGMQGVNVKGVLGGPLMCDIHTTKKVTTSGGPGSVTGGPVGVPGTGSQGGVDRAERNKSTLTSKDGFRKVTHRTNTRPYKQVASADGSSTA